MLRMYTLVRVSNNFNIIMSFNVLNKLEEKILGISVKKNSKI